MKYRSEPWENQEESPSGGIETCKGPGAGLGLERGSVPSGCDQGGRDTGDCDGQWRDPWKSLKRFFVSPPVFSAHDLQAGVPQVLLGVCGM